MFLKIMSIICSPFTKLGNWLVLCLIIFSALTRICTTLDSITPFQVLGDRDTLVSANTNFELGFFSLTDHSRRYLGIWFKNISPRTYVWVANRETPLLNNVSATLNITNQGNLVLVNLSNDIFWSSNTSIRTGQVPVAQLLNSGNFVVREANDTSSENFLWQSFDQPGNTLLPGMKLGADLERGVNRFLTAWTSTDDPATNGFSLRIDLRGYPQLVVAKGSSFKYRPGSWNGERFTGAYVQKPNPIFTYEFVINEKEVYYKYELKNGSNFVKWVLEPTGLARWWKWTYETNEWMTIGTAPIDQCENYGICGAFADCNSSNSRQCSCLDGFIPKSQMDTNAGCARRIPLNCSDKDRFKIIKGIKLPDTSNSWYDESIDLAKCQKLCLNGCSCTAYATLNITDGGSGCLQWRSDLVDLRTLPENGQDIYVRVSASELGGRHSHNLKVEIIAGSAIFSIIIMLLFLCIRRRQIRQYVMSKRKRNGHFKEMELPLFNLTEISEATNNFSSCNKLGEGGFGPVYKGRLMNDQEIAVKRLSKSSKQGLKEFENEVKLIAKLQHRNLVKLLGCCIHEDERMLIYEYMPNRSLDFFIFDETRSKFLDWQKRLHIIDGIGRGLLYLHEDSRLKIIHRDLKTSNILLDDKMNPKISDFGLARLFDIDQSEATTKRVVGTYGYMSPEYAVDGVFSMKSDVFSYGVMVLEIVSGKRNRGFSHPGHDHNLLGHAYKLWKEGTPTEMADRECTEDGCSESQVVRCIHIALLCVQQRPEDRPSMGWVVVMLSSQNPLPDPRQPGFFLPRNPLPLSVSHSSTSENQISLSEFEPR